jgi:ATP-binding cassette subfamily F protein uup
VDRVERYFEMAGQEAPEAELDVDLIIPRAPKLANRVVELKKVGMELGGRVLFENVSLDLKAGERLGIVGRNGLGKSTLLKIILRELEPSAGIVEIGARTEINYVDQNRLLLDDTKTVWEEVGEGSEHVRLGEENVTLRGYLRRFLFTEERINTKINQLSGGERSRVLLAKILKRGGNVLILDEPTNDLDLGTLRLLEEALVAFGGSVIVVSHDRYFLNRVCTAILAFAGIDDPGPAKRQPPQSDKKAKTRKLKWKEERELEGMEATILAAESEVARIEALFAEPDFYIKHADFARLEAELRQTRDEVARLYARWAELGELAAAS